MSATGNALHLWRAENARNYPGGNGRVVMFYFLCRGKGGE